jgi:transposase
MPKSGFTSVTGSIDISLLGQSLQGRQLGEIGKAQKPLTELEMELARTKKELAEVKMERDILKKAAAYFARESLPGTRQ